MIASIQKNDAPPVLASGVASATAWVGNYLTVAPPRIAIA